MFKRLKGLPLFLSLVIFSLVAACNDDDTLATIGDDDEVEVEVGTLHPAFAFFGGNVTVSLDGNEAVIEANGRPDHTSPYWNPDNSSGLYVVPDPTYTIESRMSPGFIEDYTNLFTLRVPTSPIQASSPSSTSLGPVGIAISGAPIFNDQEGNGAVSAGVLSGFDRSGAHTGPSTYHYHLEPKAFSDDDDALIGVIADGFFIYGRKCYSTGTYPTDLDDSNGHYSTTQYTSSDSNDAEYHYHVQNQSYIVDYAYLLFPGNYQGTPNSISN